MSNDGQRCMSLASLWSIGVIRSVLTSRREAPKQGAEGAPDAWLEVNPWATDGLLGIAVGRRAHRHHVAAPGTTRHLPGSPAREPEQSAHRRVRHAIAGPAEPARSSSCCRARDRRESPAHRSDGSDRRNAGRRHQARAVLSALSSLLVAWLCGFARDAARRRPSLTSCAGEVVGFLKPVGERRLDLVAVPDLNDVHDLGF